VTRIRLRRQCRNGALLLLVLLSGGVFADAELAGRSLEQALEALERDGLTLLYSSQLVTPEMRVLREPVASDPVGRLRELLAPHGLTAMPTSTGGYVIVRSDPAVEPEPSRNAASNPQPTQADVEEVVVHASRYEFMREGPVRGSYLPRGLIEKVPGVSEDAARVLHRLPGTASNGVSARTHVRGGYEDELLVQFDGIRLYNPYHLKDFQAVFGLLDPEVIESAEYFSGGFPAAYGGRAGGVLDITPRIAREMETLVGISTLNSRLVSTGRVFEGRGQWLASYRRSNLNAVLRLLERDVGEPEFEDFVLRYTQEFGSGTSATLGVLGLDDRLKLNTEDRRESASASYRDRYVWVRLAHAFDNGASGALTFSDASLSVRRFGSVQRPGVSEGELADRRSSDIDTIGVSLDLPLNDRSRLSFGAESSDASGSYTYSSRAEFVGPLADAFDREALEERSFAGAPQGRTYAAHGAARIEAGAWASEFGLRWDRIAYGGIGSEWSPRIGIRRQLNNDAAVKFAFGRYVQTQWIGELDPELEVPEFAPAESAWHAIVGYERPTPLGAMRLEAFGKRVDDVRARFENLLDPLILVPDIEVDRVLVAPDRSSAWGVELSVTSAPGDPIGWWFNYTWSQARDEFGGQEVPRSWDQRHAISTGANWAHGRWDFTIAAGWHSGWPLTPLMTTTGTEPGDLGTASLGVRNSDRYADFFSLDLRATYTLPLRIGDLEFHAEVINLTNRKNPCCREVDVADGGSSYRIDEKGWLGIAPILGVDWRF
jgi:hypothetical protein